MFTEAVFEVSETKLEVYADEEQLKQVLINLVKNAIEAMNHKPEGVIKIEWFKQNNQVEIHVLDEGTGINNLENLFVPFYTTKAQGSGIGIVLCRQIIMNHSGDLTINNRDDGCGAKASVFLPAS